MSEQFQPRREECNGNGRSINGNGESRRNQFARHVAALYRALRKCVTREDFDRIAKVLIRRAKEGNVIAAKLLFTYVYGKRAKPPE